MYDLKPKTCSQLLDAFVGSILNYTFDIWGFTKSEKIERIHLQLCKQFCKQMLQVRLSMCLWIPTLR